jgi:hypothetical protein
MIGGKRNYRKILPSLSDFLFGRAGKTGKGSLDPFRLSAAPRLGPASSAYR